VNGEYVTLASPSATTLNDFDFLPGLIKDKTYGDVSIFQSDPFWGSLELLSCMEPSETVAAYRRYYLHNLPRHCQPFNRWQNTPPNPSCPCRPREYVLVTALAKLDLIPVECSEDYLYIPNVEALVLEAQSIRMGRMDDPELVAKAANYHRDAIRLLQGQLYHLYGKNQPAINFRPFGSASLDRVRINMI
jgi:hypothetical protein